ncbi:hypothetical protein R1flu_010669 [Riccia fluitans]|uniref:Uncharacterized protein n=1 Tax=Riccia fluitans TaxID=41844 RepID=A0ABD1Z9S4_9MARC
MMENIAEQMLVFEAVQLSGLGGSESSMTEDSITEGRQSEFELQGAKSSPRSQIPTKPNDDSTRKLPKLKSRSMTPTERIDTKDDVGKKDFAPRSLGYDTMVVAERSMKVPSPAEYCSKLRNNVVHSSAEDDSESCIRKVGQQGQTLLPRMAIDIGDEGQLTFPEDIDPVKYGETEDRCSCDPCSYCFR